MSQISEQPEGGDRRELTHHNTMRTAVSILLLLATLPECRFMTSKGTPPEDLTCGQSPALRRREPLMALGAGLGRILGGEATKGCSMVPWQVRLKINYVHCGGSIISSNHILTAAHCIQTISYWPDIRVVRVADYDVNVSEEKVLGVKKIEKHELYSKASLLYDIAIITLNQSLTFGDCVTPICLDPTFVPNGDYCVVAGWGKTKFGGPHSDVLKMLRVKTHKGSDCKHEFNITHPNFMKNLTTQVCAGHIDGRIGTCLGDSGGALACWHNGRYVQAGIVSYALGCGLPNTPTVYTNVPFYHDWIMDKIGNKSS